MAGSGGEGGCNGIGRKEKKNFTPIKFTLHKSGDFDHLRRRSSHGNEDESSVGSAELVFCVISLHNNLFCSD